MVVLTRSKRAWPLIGRVVLFEVEFEIDRLFAGIGDL